MHRERDRERERQRGGEREKRRENPWRQEAYLAKRSCAAADCVCGTIEEKGKEEGEKRRRNERGREEYRKREP